MLMVDDLTAISMFKLAGSQHTLPCFLEVQVVPVLLLDVGAAEGAFLIAIASRSCVGESEAARCML